MDKINRDEFNMYHMTNHLPVLILNKLDELIEGYNELHRMVMRLERIRQANNEVSIIGNTK